MASHREVAERLASGTEEERSRMLKGSNMIFHPKKEVFKERKRYTRLKKLVKDGVEREVVKTFPSQIRGYGGAIYAVRVESEKHDDTVIVFDKWRDYSNSLGKRIGIIESAARRSSETNLVYLKGNAPSHTMERYRLKSILEEEKIDYDELHKLGPVKSRPKG